MFETDFEFSETEYNSILQLLKGLFTIFSKFRDLTESVCTLYKRLM